MSGYLTIGVTEMTDSVAHFLKKRVVPGLVWSDSCGWHARAKWAS